MKVLFDHQIFERQRWGGISRYFVELARGMRGRAEVDLSLARTLSDHRGELRELLGVEADGRGFRDTFLGGRRFPLSFQLWSLAKAVVPGYDAKRANRSASLARIAAGGFDLLHPTYFDPYFLDALGGRPFVLTIHDFTYEVFPELFPPRDPLPAWKRRLAEKAARIVVISEHTRRDLERFLDVDPAKVDLIHHGCAPAPAAPRPPPGLPERYVLFTGARAGYKNWGRFAEAMAPLLHEDPALHVVCAGAPFTAAERERLGALGIAPRVLRVGVTGGELAALYAGAAAFVFPSLYEGFGFPVLEALQQGCPTALARASSLPEVGGDAAVYFDPLSVEEQSGAVRRLLADSGLRAELARRGATRAAEFSWARTCERTAETYRRALEGR